MCVPCTKSRYLYILANFQSDISVKNMDLSKKRIELILKSLWEGIPRIFPQHAVPSCRKRQEKAIVQTDTAGCAWTAVAL